MSIPPNTHDSTQRQKLWDSWNKPEKELEVALEDLDTDPSDSNAAQRALLLCDHLENQMNSQEKKEDTCNLDRAFHPEISLQEIIEKQKHIRDMHREKEKLLNDMLDLQNLGSLMGGLCGIYSIGKELQEGTTSIGQLSSTESDKRLQQDLEHRRQQAEQAAKLELENSFRKAQEKHNAMRLMSS